MDMLGDVRARRGGVVEPQRCVVRVSGRFEQVEPVPEEAELVPDEGVDYAVPYLDRATHLRYILCSGAEPARPGSSGKRYHTGDPQDRKKLRSSDSMVQFCSYHLQSPFLRLTAERRARAHLVAPDKPGS
jgi:hypothetical protein